MSRRTTANGTTTTSTTGSGAQTGWFLYGLVPSDVEIDPDARGLDESPGPVKLVTHGGVAALVSEVPLDVRLGRPDDLLTYKELLDAAATEVPVVPVRFGTILDSRESVAELLAAQHDGYLAVLEELDGRLEYVVRARYVERTLLTEVLAEHPEAAALRDELRGQPEDASVDLRIRLGQIVSQAVEARRATDTKLLTDALTPFSVASVAQPAGHEQDAANVAFLVERSRRAEFEKAVTGIADDWRARATVRALGPLAAYDFVGDPTSAAVG